MFDLIKFLDDEFALLRHGTGVRLSWPFESNYTGADAERDLRIMGVRVWRRGYAIKPGDEYSLHVRPQQAEWADYILRERLAGHPLPPSRRQRGKPVGAIGASGRIIDWLFR